MLAALIVCLGLATTGFAEVTHVASEQLDAMEKVLYGTQQDSSMLARIQSLEDDLYGHEENGRNILDRIQTSYDYVCGSNGGNGSFLQQLNAVDSRFNDRLTAGPAKTRIEELENTIYGTMKAGSLESRLTSLVETAYATGRCLWRKRSCRRIPSSRSALWRPCRARPPRLVTRSASWWRTMSMSMTSSSLPREPRAWPR